MTDKAKTYGLKDISVGRSDTFRLELDKIAIRPGWNAREYDFSAEDEDDLALARSIAEVGVVTPLTVVAKDGTAFVTDGHRRFAAALYARDILGADIKSVPVQAEGRYSNEADHVLSMIVRNAGKPLSPFAKSKVFKRLIDLGWSEDDIAKKTGVTRTRVVQLLTVQAAPEEVKALVAEGSVSADLALKAVREAEGDGEKAAQVLTEAVETAKAEGKTRATAKHLEGAQRPNLKRTVKEAFEAAAIDTPAESDEEVTVRFKMADFDRLREMLGL